MVFVVEMDLKDGGAGRTTRATRGRARSTDIREMGVEQQAFERVIKRIQTIWIVEVKARPSIIIRTCRLSQLLNLELDDYEIMAG